MKLPLSWPSPAGHRVEAWKRLRPLVVLRVLACILLLLETGGAGAQSLSAPDAAESVTGTLRVSSAGKPEPVAGAKIVLTEPDGSLVKETRSGPDGRFEIAVPKAASYVLTLDPASLPEGVTLRAGRPQQLKIDLLKGQRLTVLFPLEAAGAVKSAAPPKQWMFAQLLVDGLVFGIILALASVGLSLIYSVSGVINFAHGELISIGALLTFALSTLSGGPQISLLVAAPLAIVAVAALGGLFDAALFRRLTSRAQEHFAILIFTIGLSFALRYMLLALFGANTQPYREYALQEPIRFGPILLIPRDIWIVALALTILLGLSLVLQRTRLGRTMRAVADNPSLAGASGINVNSVIRDVWIVGTGIAAAGGVLLAVSQQSRWDMGYMILMFVFASVILGGIGTAFGTIAGGIIIGVAVQISTFIFPAELKAGIAMLVMTIVLLVRPQGLFGRAQRVG
jgi:branched-chain amino acid transport system permease protein